MDKRGHSVHFGDTDSSDVTVILWREPEDGFDHDSSCDSGEPDQNQLPGYQNDGFKNKIVLASFHLHSQIISMCSGYYEACLSERWAGSEKKTSWDSNLESQTSTEYYENCFHRMYRPFKSIPTVDDCIQLLIVASQIHFQDLMKECICILSCVPWTQTEKFMINSFHSSIYWRSDLCASDLIKRLEGTKVKTDIGLRAFSEEIRGYLAEELEMGSTAQVLDSLPDDRDSMSLSTHLSTSERTGSNKASNGMNDPACKRTDDEAYVTIATSSHNIFNIWFLIARKETDNILETITPKCKSLHVSEPVTSNNLNLQLRKIRWLISLFLRTKATEDLVNLVLTERDLAECLRILLQEVAWPQNWKCEWAQLMIESIVEAIMDKDWVLDTSEKIEVSLNWGWLIELVFDHSDGPLVIFDTESEHMSVRLILGLEPHELCRQISRECYFWCNWCFWRSAVGPNTEEVMNAWFKAQLADMLNDILG